LNLDKKFFNKLSWHFFHNKCILAESKTIPSVPAKAGFCPHLMRSLEAEKQDGYGQIEIVQANLVHGAFKVLQLPYNL
jgi:hypothetical protein